MGRKICMYKASNLKRVTVAAGSESESRVDASGLTVPVVRSLRCSNLHAEVTAGGMQRWRAGGIAARRHGHGAARSSVESARGRYRRFLSIVVAAKIRCHGSQHVRGQRRLASDSDHLQHSPQVSAPAEFGSRRKPPAEWESSSPRGNSG